ncbi:N-lysine methyltransferase KMT5A-A-like [Thunnus maccoyii]|uniref:N-lysine methyltransferase KMT5A-A-like n=1 Tax=Thunnus maccoyii TaxID=8240 RepID=UPI001C4BF4A5|nr:N-lysine methyltransferase KMT5A-A-like [Thunnus maccoyii]
MGKKLCIDAAREDDSLGRLVNDDHDIRPGEEITYNYGDSDWPWRLKVSTEAHPHHAAWASDCTKDVILVTSFPLNVDNDIRFFFSSKTVLTGPG